MTENSENQNWPIPKFYYLVDWGETKNIVIQEMNGLEIENRPMEYRSGNSPVFSKLSMPGLESNNNITFKNAIIPKNKAFWDWHKRITLDNPIPETIIVKLMDEEGNPTMSWTLTNATPVKDSYILTDNGNNEIVIERIVIKHNL